MKPSATTGWLSYWRFLAGRPYSLHQSPTPLSPSLSPCTIFIHKYSGSPACPSHKHGCPTPPLQHHQWLRPATQRGAQAVSAAGPDPLAQGQDTQHVPPTAGLLRGPVSGEGPRTDRVCSPWTAQVLAQSPQSQGGGWGRVGEQVEVGGTLLEL